MRRLVLTIVAGALVAGGCASGGEPGGADVTVDATTSTAVPPSTTTSTRPVTTSTAPTETLGGRMTMEIDGRERVYQLFVPPGHDIHEPAPLVIVAHGGRSSSSVVIGRSGFDALAAEEGIVVVYPEGDQGVWDFDDGAGMDRPEVDDVRFVSAVIDEVAAMVAIDEERVYAVGFSQGFGLAALLACHTPDRISSVVSVAGLIHHDGAACPEPRPARVLAIAGEGDPNTTGGHRICPLPTLPGPSPTRSRPGRQPTDATRPPRRRRCRRRSPGSSTRASAGRR